MSLIKVNDSVKNYDVWERITKDLILLNGKFADIEELPSHSKWYLICRYKTLSESFIRKYQNRVNWRLIFMYQTHLSEDFIREFQGKPFWNWIFKYWTLSESFIRECKYIIDDYDVWNWIFRYQTHLSEDFLREFKGKPYWYYIFRYQKNLSEDFLREFK